MPEEWSNFIDEMLLNCDQGKPRDIGPVEDRDKQAILPLKETDALVLWELFLPERAKLALLFERTYGPPAETVVLEEDRVSAQERKKILDALHKAETPVLVYWNRHIALKTDWGRFVKYWDNFFYYPEDAIVFVDRNNVYFYNEMTLKRLTMPVPNDFSDESVFDCLEWLKDKEEKRALQMNCLLAGVPDHLQDGLYRLLHTMSVAFKVIKEPSAAREYMKFCLAEWCARTEKIVLAAKPYSRESLRQLLKEAEEGKNAFDAPSAAFYEILQKIAGEQA